MAETKDLVAALRHCATVHDCNRCDYGCDTSGLPRNRELLIAAADAIDQMPTISPDEVRGVGKWISNHDGSWNCSECGLRVLIYAKGNYCPNCGAKMEVSEDA